MSLLSDLSACDLLVTKSSQFFDPLIIFIVKPAIQYSTLHDCT